MKTLRTCLIIVALSCIAVTCKKDDDFVHVSVFETALHDEVNNYRATQGLNQLTLQFVMVKEAQAHAVGRANGSISAADVQSDMQLRWHTVEDKLGVTKVSNEAYISSQIMTATAAEVVASWAADSIGKIILEGDYTLSGPGTGTTSDGRTYIMHMFCKWSE